MSLRNTRVHKNKMVLYESENSIWNGSLQIKMDKKFVGHFTINIYLKNTDVLKK